MTLSNLRGHARRPYASKACIPFSSSRLCLPVTECIKELGRQALLLPWVADIRPDDVRFQYPGPQMLPDYLRGQLDKQWIPLRTVALLRALVLADRMTASEEVTDIVHRAARRVETKRLNTTPSERLRAWPAAYRQLRFVPGTTYEEVSRTAGISPSRLARIRKCFDLVLATAPFVTPSLDRLAEEALCVAPADLNVCGGRLRQVAGTGLDLDVLFKWIGAVKPAAPPIKVVQKLYELGGDTASGRMLHVGAGPSWVDRLVQHLRLDLAHFGCSSLVRVAGQLSLQDGVAPGRSRIVEALKRFSTFVWLDEGQGWFSIGDVSHSALALRVSKIMAVANTGIAGSEIAGACASETALLWGAPGEGVSVPPPHVCNALLATWPWLRAGLAGAFTPVPGERINGALTELERLAVRVIESNGGVAWLSDVIAASKGEVARSRVGVQKMLSNSPLVFRLEKGLYAVRGRAIENEALKKARARKELETEQRL